ncbi:MAG: ammonium transporter [Candidatus Aquicultorales bacterium]
MSRVLKLVLFIVIAAVGLSIAGMALAADPSGAATGTAKDLAPVAAGEKLTLQNLADELGHTKIATNFIWIIFGTALIFFMQAGFALVETGFCRAKNAGHVIMTNFVIFAIGTLGFFATGFAIMFGGVGSVSALGGVVNLDGVVEIAKGWGIIGTKGFFGSGTYDVGIFAFFLFQLVFMDTAATIVTGAMAERWKFSAFVIFGFFMSMILYPLFGNWVWGGGWLAKLGTNLGLGNGFLDFAGSSVVHAMGGFTALAGAIVLGPRLGKFNKDGTPNAIPGHHIPMAIVGTIILVFGWIGFNGASTVAAGDFRLSIIIANTFLAGSAGALAAMLLMWKLYGKPDASMTANGMLAGLVAIKSPTAFVAPWAAIVIGTVGGLLVVASVLFVERVLKVDDPVGAISVHGANGLWGVIALGIFADGTYGAGFNGIAEPVKGLLYGNGGQLVAQLIGAGTVFAVAFGVGYVFFKVQDMVMGIRSSAEDELRGLDLGEIGALAYPDFAASIPEIHKGGQVPHPVGVPNGQVVPDAKIAEVRGS